MQTSNPLLEFSFLLNRQDAYGIHRDVWGLMAPPESPVETRQFQYATARLPGQSKGVLVTVRAPRPFVPERFHTHASPVATVFARDSKLGFQVVACASHRPLEPAGSAGQRRAVPEIACRGRQEHLDWLKRQGDLNGFAVRGESCDFANEPESIHKGKGARPFVLNRALFIGRLTVTDPGRFSLALRQGIGRHRGLGFGLMRVFP